MHRGPVMLHEIVSTAESGTRFDIAAENLNNDWWQIVYESLPTWVYAPYVTAIHAACRQGAQGLGRPGTLRAIRNEISSIPELLQLLDMSGCIVTVDAISCQKSASPQNENRPAGIKTTFSRRCKLLSVTALTLCQPDLLRVRSAVLYCSTATRDSLSAPSFFLFTAQCCGPLSELQFLVFSS